MVDIKKIIIKQAYDRLYDEVFGAETAFDEQLINSERIIRDVVYESFGKAQQLQLPI